MKETHKCNIHYFESDTMNKLYKEILNWQKENSKRLLSLNIHKEKNMLCCIALTNPTEVVITNKEGTNYADVSYAGCLKVDD